MNESENNKTEAKTAPSRYTRDLIIVAVLLLAALALFFLMRSRQERDTGIGAQAVVTVDGREIGRYPLRKSGTFSLNGDSTLKEVPLFRIMGTKGILDLNDANQFGGSIRYLPGGQRDPNWQDLEMISPLSGNSRGIGPADMARCIREGGTHLASMEMACHVLDVMEKILKSGSTNLPQDTETSCVRPAAFDSWRELLPKEAETDLP